MSNPDFLTRLREIGRNIPLAYREERFAQVEEELLTLLDIAGSPGDKCDVLCVLANHYHYLQNDALGLEALQKSVAYCPDDVNAWIGLTEHFHYHDVDLTRAAECVETALQKATAANALVRQVLGVRLRIALEQDNHDLVNATLTSLIDFVPSKGSIDVAFETDFISRMPLQFIDRALLERYKALAGVGVS
jgi:hypothetical protein